MMNKFGAMLFVAVAAQALPLNAQGVPPAAQGQNAQNQNAQSRIVARQTQTVAAPNEPSDVTGSIDKGARARVTVSPIDSSRAAQASSQGKPPISYEEAFRNWRTCAVLHQSVGNPPPQCEPLRIALRQAIALRPRGYQSVDARPRS
jgi:hypothetical protein